MKKTLRTFLVSLMTVMLMLTAIPVSASEPSSTGDGLMPYDQLLSFIRLIDDGHVKGMLYEEIVALVGVEGQDDGNEGPNSMSTLGDHYFRWIDRDESKNYIRVCFRGKEETGRFEQTQCQTNRLNSETWKNADITDWVIALSAGVGVEDFSQDIQHFSNPCVTVTGRIPVEKWSATSRSNSLNIEHVLGNNYDPCIEIKVYDSLSGRDLHINDYENLQPAAPRMIAGIEMEGRTYTYKKRDWTEYSVQLEDDVVLGVQIMSSLNIAPGTQGDAVLESLAFRYTASDGTEKAHGPNPEPTPEPTPAPTPTAEPIAAPMPKLAEGVERYVASLPESDVPAHWHKLELTNERTAIGMQVYFPVDEAYPNEVKIAKPNYYARDSMGVFVDYRREGWRDSSYVINGMFALSKPPELEFERDKYLAGDNMNKEKYTFERIQTENGLIMERVAAVDGMEVRYYVISPETTEGETVFLTLQLTAPKEDMLSDWSKEVCRAFEQTVRIVWPGKEFVMPGLVQPESQPELQPGPGSAPAEPQSAPSASESIVYGQKYVAKTFTTGGVTMESEPLGIFDITFYKNGTCDFTMTGFMMKDMKWSEQDGKAVMMYSTMPIAFTPTVEGLVMDYFGAGTLLMKPE